MQLLTPTPVTCARFWAWLIIATVFSMGTAVAAPIYSTSGKVSASSTCSNPIACLTAGTGVDNAMLAATNPLDDYATIYKSLSVGTNVSLRLGLSSAGKKGDRAGVLVSLPGNLLGLSVLGTYMLKTYITGTAAAQETRVVSADLVQRLLSGKGRPTQLEFVANAPFDEVELVVSGAASLLYTLNVYYAYAVPALVQPQVKGALSRFGASDLSPYYGAGTSTPGIVSACVGVNIQNPQNAVDNDLTNYAQFTGVATVGCPSALTVKLEGPLAVPAGYYAGFVIGSDGLLDLSVLSGLRITTYLTVNGVRTQQESTIDAGLLELKLLPNGQTQVSFPTKLPFDEVKLERVGAVTLLDNLKIYYGFGVEPRAFQGTTRVLSDFATGQTTGKYEVSTQAGVCVNCGVATPQGAADNDPNTTAVMTVPLAIASKVELKLTLNGTANGGNVGAAGNRAGMVIGDGVNLLDLTLLDKMTITTYDKDGNLLESASGRSLIALNLLADGRQEISFLTTQNFASVQLSIAGGVSALVNIPVHYAFADDRSGGLPSLITPLPVELTAFSGRWVSGAAELSWATASEKNSSYFVVERSTGSDAAFRAVGQVAAAGTSTSALTYRLRDAEAGAQGVAVLYYRLRQVDVDGKEAFSPLISVTVGKLAAAAPQLEVYPNPAPDAAAVMVNCPNLPAAGCTVLTYSEMGQLVSKTPITESTTRLSLPQLTSGLYHIVLRDATGRQLATQRLVVGGR